MNRNSHSSNNLTVLSDAFSKLPPDTQLVLSQATATAVITTLQSATKVVEIVAEGHQYRNTLQAMVQALKTDQSMRHKDVEELIKVLREFSAIMSQDIRDQFFMSILLLLKSPRQQFTLPQRR
ncbi:MULTISPECIES: hypothetical protein [Calothrix]|uniref:Uncharacterized protein n=2 Tax=Calothrix TaxID=1186 RepID=A0ABR8ALB4_9CYAN|nr:MULTISPECIES: hypothetical protein [Calothrix]MBD2200822.1 hypothetical protein [Calothrix parietina FACHB-288]MBD2229859.1 hypothetical protein [Calothrix anomala FACHB-343]